MSLYALGLNHQTAPLAVRERVVFHVEKLYDALLELTRRRFASEAAILSTCNRVEIYARSDSSTQALPALSGFLSRHGRVDSEQLAPHLYRLAEPDSVQHLFRVAGGLDSMVLGETEILH